MGKPLRALIVEDSERDAELLLRELYRGGFDVAYERVETAEAMAEALTKRAWNIIFSDYSLPRFGPLSALSMVHAEGLDLPFIIVSGTAGEEAAVEAMRAGARDYFRKDRLSPLLIAAVERELREAASRAERRRADDALRRAEERYRGIFENAVVGIFQTTLDGRHVTANPTLARIYGYESPEELMAGMTDLNRQFYTQPGRREEFIRLVEERGIVHGFESQVCCKDGRVIWISEDARAVCDAEGRLVGFEGTTVDITARKLAEQERERLAAILDATPDFVAIAETSGRPLYLNRAARTLLGIGADEGLARVLIADGHAEWARKLVLETAIPTAFRHGVWKGETAFFDREGREIPFSQVILAHKGPDGGVAFLSTIAHDLSEQKSLEARLRQAQKMEAIGRLAGGIAHDFNNLLTAILGYSHLVEAELGEGHRLRGDVAQIRMAGERAATLTRQLLAFSRKQVLVPVVLDLNVVVADTEKMLRRLIGEDIELVTILEPALDRVKIDRSQIEQVVMNLAVNSRDAMPDGGRLTIETRNVHIDAPLIWGDLPIEPGFYVILAVSDTGSGMDEATKSHVFEPFFTTKGQGKGTGLGLATVHGIVRQSGGHIWLYSEVGRGATFKIYLPRAETRQGGSPILADVPAEHVMGTETVLLVEDDEAVRDLAGGVLQSYGYTVIPSSTPEEAQEQARNHSGNIHLLLTDVVMPGMSGSELARQVASFRPGIRVLFMSGYTDESIGRHLEQHPGRALLEKPFTPASLARWVRAVLDCRTD